MYRPNREQDPNSFNVVIPDTDVNQVAGLVSGLLGIKEGHKIAQMIGYGVDGQAESRTAIGYRALEHYWGLPPIDFFIRSRVGNPKYEVQLYQGFDNSHPMLETVKRELFGAFPQ